MTEIIVVAVLLVWFSVLYVGFRIKQEIRKLRVAITDLAQTAQRLEHAEFALRQVESE